MANFVTDAYRNNAMGLNTYTNVQLDADTLSIMLIDNADDTVVAGDGDLSAIASGAREPAAGSCPNLGTKTIGTVAVGVFDAADTTFTALTGDPTEQLLLFKNTGTDATSILIASWDITATPNGGDITVVWNASGIFKF